MKLKLRVKGTGEPVRNAIIKDGVVHVLRTRKYNECSECTMASLCDYLPFNYLCSEMSDDYGIFDIEDVEVVQE